VTFKAGQYQHSYSILVVEDAAHEGNEMATLTLSDPSSGVVISRSVGTLTILDDD